MDSRIRYAGANRFHIDAGSPVSAYEALRWLRAHGATPAPLVVACPACGAAAGALCRSHGGARMRRSDVHQPRTAAYKAAPPDISIPDPRFAAEITEARPLHGRHGLHNVIAIRSTDISSEALVWHTDRHTPKWNLHKATAKLGWKLVGELTHDEDRSVRTGQAVPVTREERIKAVAAVTCPKFARVLEGQQ